MIVNVDMCIIFQVCANSLLKYYDIFVSQACIRNNIWRSTNLLHCFRVFLFIFVRGSSNISSRLAPLATELLVGFWGWIP